MDKKPHIKPFLKWAGGKRWLVSNHISVFPATYNRYIEPFLGSASVFFLLRPQNSLLSDINIELITTYRAIKKDWEKVFTLLKRHHKNHCKLYYYKMRSSKPRTIYSRAARIIYLNRTCWNGLYRVNQRGDFNVPLGTKTNVIFDSDDFESISLILKNAVLKDKGYKHIIDKAESGDLLFVDPPYTVKHDNNGFIKYNEDLFSWDDQERLSECLIRAKKRGANIIHTNANNRFIKKLYRDHFEIQPVTRSSSIAANSDSRGKCKELIITG